MDTPEHFKQIRSFVLRTTRMTDGQKKALEDLYPVYGIDVERASFATGDLFPGFQRFVLEIGFGMGDATLELAAAQPDTAFLAIDVHTPGIGKVLAEIDRRGLKNLKVVNFDAVQIIPRLESRAWDGIHIFFPDPWPKKKHHKRRLLQAEFVKTLVRPLKTGGYLYAATDWEEYALEIHQVFTATPGLANNFDLWADVPWRPKTKFETRGLKENRPIREIFFHRTSD